MSFNKFWCTTLPDGWWEWWEWKVEGPVAWSVCVCVFVNVWLCVLDMLKLVSNKRCRTSSSSVAPDVIMLRDGLMIFGRSYKADIKLMMPYVSRKHFSVSTFFCYIHNIDVSLWCLVCCFNKVLNIFHAGLHVSFADCIFYSVSQKIWHKTCWQ